MAGLAVKGCARAAVSCTFSTAGFQTSRNGVQALLAEAFGNSSVLSQLVTKGIINLLHSIAAFSDILEPKQKSIRLAPATAWDFPGQCIRKLRRRKSHASSCSSWVLGECHRQNSTSLSRGLQGLQHKNKHDEFNSATDSYCFLHIQVCKFLLEDAAYEMIWMGTLWFLAPAGFQSTQRSPAPRQWHAQGQVWRKAAHEHGLGKNPSNPFGWVPNAQKTCWPTQLPRAVQGLGPAFIGAHSEIHSGFPWSWGPGFSLRDWPSRFVPKTALILQPLDTRSLMSARKRMMALGKFMIIWSTPRIAVKALHTFCVLYPPKVSLRSDILEARHQVQSFTWLGKLLNQGPETIWTFDTFRFGQQSGPSNNKALWHG